MDITKYYNKMKYYETLFEDYLSSAKKHNIHPELEKTIATLPPTISSLPNLILFGPMGSGKYTQLLLILEKYSSSHLKYMKKMTAQNEKYQYEYRMSDIHYEIDMALLGVEPKKIWNVCYSQIVDIISVKPDKSGIIVCKNFHHIHSELLEVFYSYMQKSNTLVSNIHIVFILISEHISYLPNTILNSCITISVKRPSIENYASIIKPYSRVNQKQTDFLNKINSTRRASIYQLNSNPNTLVNQISADSIVNIKELQSFNLISSPDQIPKDIFNIVCDNIIREMVNHHSLEFTEFRDSLYDILIYGLDISDSLWYILYYFIHHGYLEDEKINEILDKIHTFLKYYNNNFRPIYHLESIFFYLITTIHKYPPCILNTRK